MTTINLTKATIETAPLPCSGRAYLKDAKVPGLQLQITSAGTRSFQVYRWVNTRPMRVTLGRYPDMTIDQARRAALSALSELAVGGNPNERKRVARKRAAEPTFCEVLARFLIEKRNASGRPLAERTKEEYRKVARNHLGPILNKRLSDITVQSVRAAHRAIRSAAAANYARALLSSVWSFATVEGVTDLPNPGAMLRRQHIESRDRFLMPDELPRFFEAVDESPLRDFFLLALLTGARRSNIQAMRWVDIDLDSATWRIPITKNGTPQNVTLAPEAVEILQTRRELSRPTDEYVFPGRGKKVGHLVEPKGSWKSLLKRAGVENLRIHDLRRTLGSWQARQGASLTIIGKSLNHKSQQATAIYARLDLDPVRQSVNNATAAMLEAGGLKQKAPVVPLRAQTA